MSTTIDTMSRVEAQLAKRLEALTGEDASCCVADYRAESRAARAAPTFEAALARAKAMADERRLLALALLKRRGEMCGCELQAALDLSHATVSHHMAALLDAGLVTLERRGKWAYYAVHPDVEELVP